MLAAIAHSFGVRAMTRDARTIYFNDMAGGPADDHIPAGHGLNLEPYRSSEAAGVDHEATTSPRASQGSSFATRSTASSDFARETQLDR